MNAIPGHTGKITADQMTGLIALYSPQMAWHGNMKWASQAAHATRLQDIPGYGGAGWKPSVEGSDGKGGMVTHAQALAAHAILKGEDWRHVLGKMKIGNFGANISTGGIGNPTKGGEGAVDDGTGRSRPKITIDRHALSGVHGKYADEGVYQRVGLGEPANYDQYVDHFANAANQINQMHGEDLQPAQMQAIDWVTQQRINGDNGDTSPKNAVHAKESFDQYAAVRHPDLVDNTPGVGFQGAGGMSRVVGGTIQPKETYHGMPTWDEDVASGNDPHPNHPLVAGGAPVAQPPKAYADPRHPLNAGNMTKSEMAAQQPLQTAASKTAFFVRQSVYHYIKEQNGKWIIWQKGTGKTLSTHDSKEQAESAFRAMEMNKHSKTAWFVRSTTSLPPIWNEIAKSPAAKLDHIRRTGPINMEWPKPELTEVLNRGGFKFPNYEDHPELMDGEPAHKHPQRELVLSKTAGRAKKGWNYDPSTDHYKTSDLNAKFSCNCGEKFAPIGFYRCGCGQSWASFDLINQGKTAANTTRVVRRVSEHRNRVLAKTSGHIVPWFVRR